METLNVNIPGWDAAGKQRSRPHTESALAGGGRGAVSLVGGSTSGDMAQEGAAHLGGADQAWLDRVGVPGWVAREEMRVEIH